MKSTFIISPHMDDAALSLGSAILAGRLGNRPTVVNVFSISNYTIDSPDAGDPEVVTELRKAEEKRACETMGTGAVFLDFPEVQTRGLVTVHELNRKKYRLTRDPLYGDIAESLRDLFDRPASALALFPLGLGNHVEHRLLNRIGRAFLNRKATTVAFYEDLPYASLMTVKDIRRVAHRVKRGLLPCSLAGVDIEKKIALLRIYESQMRDRELAMVREYHALRGGEHLWSTRSAIEEIQSLGGAGHSCPD